jgi:hypothetical protein
MISHRSGNWTAPVRRLALLVPALFMVAAFAQGPQTIQLTVDYADGVQKRFMLPFRPGMTVFDAMTAAKANPHGLSFDCDAKFPCSAAPANRVLGNIDDVKNQGGGSAAKNWQLWVNGAYADKGFGSCGIKPDDRVLWKFDASHGNQPGKACR